MDFEVHCMSILHTKLLFFNYDKVNSVLQSITPLKCLHDIQLFSNYSASSNIQPILNYDSFKYINMFAP